MAHKITCKLSITQFQPFLGQNVRGPKAYKTDYGDQPQHGAQPLNKFQRLAQKQPVRCLRIKTYP